MTANAYLGRIGVMTPHRAAGARRKRGCSIYKAGRTLKGHFTTRGVQVLDERIYRRLARESGWLNRTLVPLGKSADRSVLWMIVALVLAGTGGRRGRRGALRGTASVALTSALVNMPLKTIAGRSRPQGTSVRTRYGRIPTTSSFPSGHSASAAAFAVGAALELPKSAAPLGLLAAGVGASRIYAGVHYPSDVLAGFLAGAAVAGSLRRFWPVADADPAQTRIVRTPATTELRERGKGITFVVNNSAGSNLGPSPAELLADELPEAVIMQCDDGDDLREALESAAGAEVVGVAGGDGTINAAAAVALEHGLPLAVVPAGTMNHLTRDLGLDSVSDSIEAIRNGWAAAVDAASIDGKVFLNTASFGSYVDLVDARSSLEDRIGKWPALVIALVGVLRRSSPVDVVVDGRRRKIWMIFIGNCRYEPSGFAPSSRARLDDRLLDVRIVDGHQPWARSRLLLALLTGTLGNCGVYEHSLLTRLDVRSTDGEPIRLARDGETFDGSAHFVVEKLPSQLTVFVK